MDSQDKLTQDKTKINKAATQAISGSLLNRIHAYKREASNNLLIDVSGSMEDSVSQEGSHEYTTKRQILEDLLKKLPEGVTKFAFSSKTVQFKGDLPFEGSGTNMTGAFREMKNRGKKEIVLITDGMPDSADSALRESQGLKIDIIYIGPQPKPDFLEKLAGRTGGSFTNINLIKAGAVAQLESKITLLLNA